jgi:hypothetical protein
MLFNSAFRLPLLTFALSVVNRLMSVRKVVFIACHVVFPSVDWFYLSVVFCPFATNIPFSQTNGILVIK